LKENTFDGNKGSCHFSCEVLIMTLGYFLGTGVEKY